MQYPSTRERDSELGVGVGGDCCMQVNSTLTAVVVAVVVVFVVARQRFKKTKQENEK